MAAVPVDHEAALRACARGDEHAFQRLYELEAPHMLALGISLLGQRASAEDLLRDTFTLIWKNADSYDGQTGSARAWMYSILRYRALRRLRQAARAGEPAGAGELPDLASAGARAAPDSLVHNLARIDASQRDPILMAFYKGYTYGQIGARLRIPPTQAKTRVQVGLSLLRGMSQA